jgi:hypothetical protein
MQPLAQAALAPQARGSAQAMLMRPQAAAKVWPRAQQMLLALPRGTMRVAPASLA